MITLLYTGANSFQGGQYLPEMSLGGYISNSIIPNGRINNLFADESIDDNTNGSIVHRAIALTTDSNIDSLTINSDIDPAVSNFTLDIAAVTLIAPDYQKMESILNESDIPYIGQFARINKDITQNIGALTANQIIGIWIKRTITKATSKSCSDLFNSGINLSNVLNNIQLNFNY